MTSRSARITILRAALKIFDANGPALFYEDARCERLRDDGQVGLGDGRTQKGDRAAPATIVGHGAVCRPDAALVSAAVEVRIVAEPHLLAGLQERFRKRMHDASAGGAQQPVAATRLPASPSKVSDFMKYGRQSSGGPATVAELRPLVEIRRVATHVDLPLTELDPPRPCRAANGCAAPEMLLRTVE